ncbi:MAG: ABC transporter permease subunit, partial [Christensenellaceae bacterium]
RVLGYSSPQMFFKIILPLSKPIIIYTILTAFTAPWGEYMFSSLLMLGDPDKFTVAYGLKQMITRENIYNYFTTFCAGAVVVSIPITGLFIWLQKYYVEGVTGGAVKG